MVEGKSEKARRSWPKPVPTRLSSRGATIEIVSLAQRLLILHSSAASRATGPQSHLPRRSARAERAEALPTRSRRANLRSLDGAAANLSVQPRRALAACALRSRDLGPSRSREVARGASSRASWLPLDRPEGRGGLRPLGSYSALSRLQTSSGFPPHRLLRFSAGYINTLQRFSWKCQALFWVFLHRKRWKTRAKVDALWITGRGRFRAPWAIVRRCGKPRSSNGPFRLPISLENSPGKPNWAKEAGGAL